MKTTSKNLHWFLKGWYYEGIIKEGGIMKVDISNEMIMLVGHTIKRHRRRAKKTKHFLKRNAWKEKSLMMKSYFERSQESCTWFYFYIDMGSCDIYSRSEILFGKLFIYTFYVMTILYTFYVMTSSCNFFN